jgi:hypothetical protein
MTGAYVSGKKRNAMMEQTPAKIIITQKTHLHPRGLSIILT